MRGVVAHKKERPAEAGLSMQQGSEELLLGFFSSGVGLVGGRLGSVGSLLGRIGSSVGGIGGRFRGGSGGGVGSLVGGGSDFTSGFARRLLRESRRVRITSLSQKERPA